LRQQVACANAGSDSTNSNNCKGEQRTPQVENFSFEYTLPWSFFKTLSGNFTPIMAMAVPRTTEVYSDQLFFDSEIELAEDWDFLLANCLRYPVVDVSQIGSVYNRLEINSRDTDRQAEWEYSFFYVQEKINRKTLQLQRGWLTDYLKSLNQNDLKIDSNSYAEKENIELVRRLLRKNQNLENELDKKEEERQETENARSLTELELKKLLRRSPLLFIRRNSIWRSLLKEKNYE
jgi:hypothetical protein